VKFHKLFRISDRRLLLRKKWDEMIFLIHSIMLSYGWKRRAIAFASGCIGALALSPINVFPLIAVPLCIGVWLLDGADSVSLKKNSRRATGWPSIRAALGIGWWIGFGYFVAGLWWLGAAFLVEADQFAWALPLGVAGLPALLACFTALGFAAAHLCWSVSSMRIVALSLCLASSEWLRGILFSGFPWNDLGMVLGGNLVLGQVASLVGLHGLTLLAVLIFASPAILADQRSDVQRLQHKPFWFALFVLAALTGFGALRLSTGTVGNVDGVKIRIMQPNVPQDAKFRPENKEAILRHYLELSDRATSPGTAGITDVTHLIWPESAFPFILSRDAWALSQIGEALKSKTVLVTGAARMEAIEGDQLPGESRVAYFNAIQVIAGGGMILDSYDKVHLVPFGEYLPLSDWLESLGVRHFVHIPGGFRAGSLQKLLSIPGLPAAFPLICYEAIFPGILDSSVREESGLLLNVTNDGWFGLTAGPHQHLAQARLRTIEEGLPLLRAANTGISAIIDPYGRVIGTLPLGVEGVLDGALPRKIEPTLYSRAPLGAPLVLYGMALLALLFSRRRN
jgi:apolipoprotein N-acyltransferase